jgi:hypothetical protein
MIDWINSKYGTNLTEQDISEVKNFALLWNIYENTIFNNSFTIDQLQLEIANRNLQLNDFNDILIYFQNRYTANGNTNQRFEHLHFRPNDRMNLVRECLLNVNNNPHDKILSVGIIVYRFRNNLFHGLKDFMVLGEQNHNFRNANF